MLVRESNTQFLRYLLDTYISFSTYLRTDFQVSKTLQWGPGCLHNFIIDYTIDYTIGFIIDFTTMYLITTRKWIAIYWECNYRKVDWDWNVQSGTSCVSLSYVIPYLNIARMLFTMYAWHSWYVLCCQAHICAGSIEVCHLHLLESRSLEFISMIQWGIEHEVDRCTHYIDDLLPIMRFTVFSYWGCGQVFHYIVCHNI